MTHELHKVTDEQLPVLLNWLEQHLPYTWKLYGTLREELRGCWHGTTFYTLGWPHIMAVGEGWVDLATCKVPAHYSQPRKTSVFAPHGCDAETLLTFPGYIDWSRPLIMHTLSPTVLPVARNISQRNGCASPKTVPLVLMVANPGDITYSYRQEIPDDLTIRPLDPDLDVEFVLSTWEYARSHTGPYIRECIKSFPSVGVFNNGGECLGVELGLEWGFLGMLYVIPEARGRGLAKILTCALAEKYFEENLPAVIVTSLENTASIALHEKLGFKKTCHVTLMYHTPESGT